MKKRSLWVLPVAVAFALTGCSSAETETGSSSKPADDAPVAAEANVLDAAQVKAVVDKVMEGKTGVQVIDNDTLQKQQASVDLNAVTDSISPKECGDLQKDNSFTDLSKAYAAAGIVADANGSTTVQLLSLKDDQTRETIEGLLKFSDFGACSSMTVGEGAAAVEIESKVLDVDTKGSKDLGIAATTLQKGQALQDSVNVQAIDGSNYVLVNVLGKPGAEGLQESAVELANKTLEEAKNVK